MYSSGGSKELWTWTFIHASWTLLYVSEIILFSRLLEGLIDGHCIYECWEMRIAKNYCSVSLLSVVGKVFEKLVNNKLLHQLENWEFFSWFQYDFRSFRSTKDLLTVVFARIARAFNRSVATRPRSVALHIFNAFNRVWHVWSSSQT